MTLTQFRATLEAHGCKPRGNGQISARCPAHDDGTASLSVSEAENKILIHDQAGCSPEAVVKALNLKMADLFNDKPHRNDEHKRNANQQALNWPRCVSDFTDRAMRELAEGRGFSIEFVRWLHGKGDVGLHGGSIAFANRDQSGTVLSCHKLYDRQNKKWIFEPSGQQVSPWIFGDIATAGFILAFESQWDALAAMDKLEWHAGHGLADAAVVVTRGAGNGKLIAGRCSPDASIFAFVQNDQPAETWLAAIVAHAGCKVLRVRTPAPHKDANDWTRAGASRLEIETAIKHAKRIEQAETVSSEPSEAIPIQDALPAIVDAAEFLATPSVLPKELVSGILHQGSKLVLGGGSKTFKTWTLLDLAVAVATGEPWLSFKTIKGRVLSLNLEIQTGFFQQRLHAVAKEKGVTLAKGQIDLWNLRGHATSYQMLLPRISERVSDSGYALIILDPIYKLYGNTDENSAGAVAQLLNAVESLATTSGAAVAFGAHYSKGNQAGKEAIDRISGSGVFARDPDSILNFTRHEEADAFTVEATLRNFKPVDPFVVRWLYPLMRRDDELDPAKLKQVKGRPKKHDPTKILDLLKGGEMSSEKWQKLAKSEKGISRSTFYELLDEAKKLPGVKKTQSGQWIYDVATS